MTDELLETKEAFVKRLDGSFEKYESIVLMREDLMKLKNCIDRMENSGMRFDTIVLLLHAHTKIGKRTIIQLLEGLQEIPHKYFRYEDDE